MDIVLVRSVQNISFLFEIDFLTKKKEESTPNRVRQFGLFLDNNKLLGCKGRINNANVSKDSKNPMLLPTRHSIVDLIVRDVHGFHHLLFFYLLDCFFFLCIFWFLPYLDRNQMTIRPSQKLRFISLPKPDYLLCVDVSLFGTLLRG